MNVELATFILQISMASLYFITAFKIFHKPKKWQEHYIENTWIKTFIPFNHRTAIYLNAVLDIIVGIWLITGPFVHVASIIAGLHLVFVLLLVGLDFGTYRDFSHLIACISLAILTWPI